MCKKCDDSGYDHNFCDEAKKEDYLENMEWEDKEDMFIEYLKAELECIASPITNDRAVKAFKNGELDKFIETLDTDGAIAYLEKLLGD